MRARELSRVFVFPGIRLGPLGYAEQTRGVWIMEHRYGGGEGQAVVLIDGVCHLCQGLVRFIIPRDPKGIFKFAALQSEAGRELLITAGLETDRLNTVVLLDNGRFYTESSAVLRIARRLRFPWPAAYIFILIAPSAAQRRISACSKEPLPLVRA